MKTINIVGAGRVGQTLAYLWHSQGVFQIQAIVCQSKESAQAAVAFVGAGVARTIQEPMAHADIWLLTCPDDELAHCCLGLVQRGFIREHSIVLHCSGSLTASEVLGSAQERGASIASAHPVKSFALPHASVLDFAGTYCGIEGDSCALAVIEPAFNAIGGLCFAIKPQAKTLYHAASVMACNYLVALQELSIQAFEQAGVSRQQALTILQPLVLSTAQNVFKLGPDNALTGPIARGDVKVVSRQNDAIAAWQVDYAKLYRGLGQITLELASESQKLDPSAIKALAQVLNQ